MHARDDDHMFADHAIEDSVRKPPNETPPSVSVSDGMCGGVHLDRAQRSPYRVEELVAQPDLLLLVPPVRRLDIRSRGGPEDQDHLELWIRRTTSSHGIPVGASCSRSSSRRSSSVRCASVSGTASGVSHRLSQSSSRRRRRSAGVSFDICNAGRAMWVNIAGLRVSCKPPPMPWCGACPGIGGARSRLTRQWRPRRPTEFPWGRPAPGHRAYGRAPSAARLCGAPLQAYRTGSPRARLTTPASRTHTGDRPYRRRELPPPAG